MTVRRITLDNLPDSKLKDVWNHKVKNAHRLVHQAVKLGILVKPEKCQDCGIRPKRIIGHHENYDEPLEVIWICSSCHRRRHNWSPIRARVRGLSEIPIRIQTL